MRTSEERPRVSVGEHPTRWAVTRVVGGSTLEGIAATGAAVLGILGLVGIVPITMMSVATIAFGGALMFFGASLAWRMRNLLPEDISTWQRRMEARGMSLEFLAGTAGVALGVLSVIGLMPLTLCAVASIVYGGALVVSSGLLARLNSFFGRQPDSRIAHVTRGGLFVASGLDLVSGLGAVALGILALLGVASPYLVLISMLGLGFAAVLSGTAVCTRVLSVRYTPHHG